MPPFSMRASTIAPYRTMYRILSAEHGNVEDRRQPVQATKLCKTRIVGNCPQPSLVLGYHETERPGQVDLLLSVRHPGYFQPLCRRLDGCSPRTVLPWLNGLLNNACIKQNIEPGQLTVHADRGSSMKSKGGGAASC